MKQACASESLKGNAFDLWIKICLGKGRAQNNTPTKAHEVEKICFPQKTDLGKKKHVERQRTTSTQN